MKNKLFTFRRLLQIVNKKYYFAESWMRELAMWVKPLKARGAHMCAVPMLLDPYTSQILRSCKHAQSGYSDDL